MPMDFEDHHDEAGECLSDPCPYCRRHEDDEDETENGCQGCGAREDTECALECPNRISEQVGELAGDVQPFALDELRLETVARRGRVEHDADAPTSTRTQLALFNSEPHD